MRRVAAERDLRTVGDFLEYRYGVARPARDRRAAVGRRGLHPRRSAHRHRHRSSKRRRRAAVAGCAIGGAADHGLLHGRRPAHVGVGQRRAAHGEAGRLRARAAAGARAVGGWRGASARCSPHRTTGTSGTAADRACVYLAMLGPAFVVSPGLLQKIYGARDDRAVRIGVGLNALGLLLYAIVPVLLGIIARAAVSAISPRRSSRCRRSCCTACRRSSARSGSPRCSPPR